MNLTDLFDQPAVPMEDLEAHARRGHPALLIVAAGGMGPTRTLYLGAVRKTSSFGPAAGKNQIQGGMWSILPLCDVTHKGSDGALAAARNMAFCLGRDRFEVVECDEEFQFKRMVTVLAQEPTS